MELEKAIYGFTLYLKASNYSLSTVTLYEIAIKNLSSFLNNPKIRDIDHQDLQRFFIYLQEEYIPKRFGNNQKPLSGSSRQNYWKAIRTFFTWATEEFGLRKRPDDRLKMPLNNPKIVLPFSKEDVRALLKAAEFTKEAHPGNRKAFTMKRRTSSRDIALILLMVDTGLRVGEVSRLNISDIDLESGAVNISPFGDSARKTKSRIVYLGKNSRKAIWHYLSTRNDYLPEDPLFLSERNVRLESNAIRCLFNDLGKRAGVANCHPHRTRHYFCVEYLKAGGDIFTLQRQTGHSSLKMLQNYLALANADVAAVHRRVSPGDKVSSTTNDK
jgi:integrase/recombinase XerD